jgi:hypothetical protein
MVKDELKKQHITVTPEIEKMMIEKMIKDEIPKSSIDYIMRKAATNTIFYLPQALNKSPLENHITAQAEKRYNPSTLEKGTGYVLGAAADYMTMGGIGGSWSRAAKFVGVDLALNAAIDKVGAKETDDVPLIIAPEHRAEYKATQAKRNQEQPKPKPKENTPTVERTTETQVQPVKEQKEVAQTQPESTAGATTADQSEWLERIAQLCWSERHFRHRSQSRLCTGHASRHACRHLHR